VYVRPRGWPLGYTSVLLLQPHPSNNDGTVGSFELGGWNDSQRTEVSAIGDGFALDPLAHTLYLQDIDSFAGGPSISTHGLTAARSNSAPPTFQTPNHQISVAPRFGGCGTANAEMARALWRGLAFARLRAQNPNLLPKKCQILFH
jgi:hypothetical protein